MSNPTTQTISTNGNGSQPTAVDLHEAPYSATVKAVDRFGFEWLFTTRAITQEGFFKRIDALSDQLDSDGYTPTQPRRGSDKPAETNEDDPSWCPVHQVKMKKRESNGQVWYSHKDGDDWCRGGKKK